VRGRLLEENKARVELLFDDSQPVFEVAHSISVQYFEGKRNSQRTVKPLCVDSQEPLCFPYLAD
jgi:hypothetical protein